MKRAFLRLKRKAGESFSEVLVALLIVALASMLLASMYSASGAIDANVKKQDKDFYDELSAVEAANTTDPTGPTLSTTPGETITIKGVGGLFYDTITKDVTVYEVEDGLKSYR